MRDRDYLLDRHGIVFKVIGDVHPDSHYLGYVKYHPHRRGDRVLFGRSYQQNSVVSRSFGILARRPECYVYSDALGSVITGVPRRDVVRHYSARRRLAELHHGNAGGSETSGVGGDLLAIVERIAERGWSPFFGVTGSFLVGCANRWSDIDLVSYGPEGYGAARELFADRDVIGAYEGEHLTRLYLRRAKYMEGSRFETLMEQERRKFQGMTAGVGAHINCEPLRSDTAGHLDTMRAKEIGEITLLATVTDHAEGVLTPALYRIRVDRVLHSTVDDPESFADRIVHLRSYLGAYTGAFRAGDSIHVVGRLVHLSQEGEDTFGVELTPWTASRSYLADLAPDVAVHGNGTATRP
ncbi:hypothetical protein [Nocardiopsis sp. CC223A]|uniref:hypothetical protein n=1 Tax=Nocardiopsis sp. CC223A TaxID=3044051 RepID=UPI00278C5B83|nr:hypothetical protein [Nocardiopsis sp. CC223A]